MLWAEARFGIHPVVTFCLTQLVYTSVSFLYPVLFWNNYFAHTAFVVFLITFVVWSAASWYMEVFVKIYQKRFAAEEERKAQGSNADKAQPAAQPPAAATSESPAHCQESWAAQIPKKSN